MHLKNLSRIFLPLLCVGLLATLFVYRASIPLKSTHARAMPGAVTTSPSGTSGDWPTFGYNAAHTRYNPNETTINTLNVSSLVRDWSYTTGSSIQGSSTVANGVAYIGDWSGKLYAVNATTGAQLWSYPTGGWIESSPAVANVANTTVVYFGSLDAKIYALNAITGAFLWSYKTNNSIWNSPVVTNGVVYIGSEDHNLYALNAATGAFLWSYPTGNLIYSSPAVANGVVYFGSSDDNLYAVNTTTGKKLWSYAVGASIQSSPVVANGVVYFGSYDDKVYAVSVATGKSYWSSPYKTGSWIYSSPAFANGVIYVGSGDHNLYALNAATGAFLWSYPTGDSIYSSPAVANGVVYVGSDDHNLYALNAATGKKLWSYTTNNSIYSSPTVANGIVYVGSWGSTLYAFFLLEKVAVPSYFYPGSLWTQMGNGVPTVGLSIINPGSGPGTSKNPDYVNQVNQTEATGMTVIGYVSTAYAGTQNVSRTLAAAERDVDTYYSWYPNIEGIFVDEVSTDCGSLNSYYQPLYNYIKNKGGKATVVLNPGTNTSECYMSAGDIIVNFEDSYANYVNWTPVSWVSKYSASRFWQIIHDTSLAQMPQAVALSKQRNAGWVYATDNPYDMLPSYWSSELSQVQ